MQDPSELLESKTKTKMPCIIRWSLVKLEYQEFVKKHPMEPLVISNTHKMETHWCLHSCVYYYIDIRPAVVNEVK